MIDLNEAAYVFARARAHGMIQIRLRFGGKDRHSGDRRAYLQEYHRTHYKPTGRAPGRPSESGLSRKALGASEYQRQLYRLRFSAQQTKAK